MNSIGIAAFHFRVNFSASIKSHWNRNIVTKSKWLNFRCIFFSLNNLRTQVEEKCVTENLNLYKPIAGNLEMCPYLRDTKWVLCFAYFSVRNSHYYSIECDFMADNMEIYIVEKHKCTLSGKWARRAMRGSIVFRMNWTDCTKHWILLTHTSTINV